MRQSDIQVAIMGIHMVISCIDDGYHQKQISNLIETSNELFEELDLEHKSSIQELLDGLSESGAI